MSFMSNPSSLDYTSNTGTASHSGGAYLYSGVPSSTTLNGPNGPFKLGNLILNTLTGTLYYLASVTTTGGVTSATWNVLESSSGGVLSVSGGGTGNSTLTAHNVLLGEGTSAVAFAAPGTSGQVLTSNGATSDPTFQAVAGTTLTAWVPNLQIGGSSTGITYSPAPQGFYTQIGSIVFFSLALSLSSKGSNSGAVTISNMPVAFGTNGNTNNIPVAEWGAITLTSDYTTIGASGNASSTMLSFAQLGSGQTIGTFTAAQLSNTSNLFINGFYFTN